MSYMRISLFALLAFLVTAIGGEARAQFGPPSPCIGNSCLFNVPVVLNSTLNGWPLSFGVLYQSAGPPVTPGVGYAAGDTMIPAGGTATTPAVLVASTTKALSATVAAGGAGGTPGACTVTGTTGTGTRAQFSGTVSGGGALTGALTVAVAGIYNANPTAIASEPVTGCGLTGAQVSMTMGLLSFQVQSQGVYSKVPPATTTQASSSGGGTGATFGLGYGFLVANVLWSNLGFTAVNMGMGPGALINIGTGHENTAYGPSACIGVRTGVEDSCFGVLSGGNQDGSFNNYFGGVGPLLTGNGSNNTVGGQDAVRSATDINNMALWGGNAAHDLPGSGAGEWAGIGANVFFHNVAQGPTNRLAAVGYNGCFGAVGAVFTNVSCFGGNTAGALLDGNGDLFLGQGVGNSVLVHGIGVILMGSGNVAVDAPSATTNNYINIENVLKVSGTNVPSTSFAEIEGILNVVGQIQNNGVPIGTSGYTVGLANAPFSTAAPAAPGSGYAIGDSLVLADGCATHASAVVVTLSGSGVATWQVVSPGVCAAAPANPVAIGSSSGAGTGATLTTYYGPLTSGFLLQSSASPNFFLSTTNGFISGGQNVLLAARAGFNFTGASNNNTAAGFGSCGGFGAATFVGVANSCFGQDAATHLGAAASSIDVFGAGVLAAQALAASQIVGMGTGTLANLNVSGVAKVFALGTSACVGAAGTAAFSNGGCFGANTGGALSTASHFLLMGQGVANGVYASGNNVMEFGTGSSTVDTPAAGTSNWLNINNVLLATMVKPLISTGFGTAPTTVGPGSLAFQISVGSGGTASTGAIVFATAAPTGWNCDVTDITSTATANTVQTGSTTTTATFTNFLRSTGAVTAWPANDNLNVKCVGF